MHIYIYIYIYDTCMTGSEFEFCSVNKNKQRLWRRFLRDYARYQVHDEVRLQAIAPRYDRLQKVLAKEAYELANKDRYTSDICIYITLHVYIYIYIYI